MADLDKVKRNVAKMVGQNAPEADIDSYLSSEGVSVDQVRAHKVGAAKPAPPPQTGATKQPSTAMDMLRGAYSGLASNLNGFVNSGGPLQLSEADPQYKQSNLPDEEVKPLPGSTYRPKTTPGKYAETIAAFAPGALIPGTAAARIARTVIPAVASEAAGQATEGSELEPYARVAGALAGGFAPSIAGAGLRVANKVAESTVGAGFLNPNVEAARRLTKAFSSDGGIDTALSRSASFADSGASAPSVMDLGGGNVRRLVRAASGAGDEAHNVATSYADRVRSNLQDNVISRANKLTPDDPRSAAQLGTDLEAGQRELADTTYKAPYANPASVTPEMVSALQGPTGRRAIGEAYATAEARRDAKQMAELSDLRAVAEAQSGGQNALTGRFQSLDEALRSLSAGSLDRVRIAMRERSGALAASGRRGMASGLKGRVNDIDTALDQTPGLTDARASYRQMQASRDSVDAGATVLSSPSATYSAQLSELAGRGGPPNLRPAQVGARQAITDAVEAPAAGQTGVLTKLATGNRATANLANTFGAERAGSFQEAVRNEVSRLRNANFISPETGSQTQLRLGDEGLVGGIPTSIGSFVSKIADKVLRGTQLTAAEREAIVRLGTSEADIRRFAQPGQSGLKRAATPAALINSSRSQSSQDE